LVRNKARPSLGLKTLDGDISWRAQRLSNLSTSYMDRTPTGHITVSAGVSYQSLGGNAAKVTFTPGLTGSLKLTMIDANPSDKIAIADVPVFPAAGGVPQVPPAKGP
jgi:hypothetical protein